MDNTYKTFDVCCSDLINTIQARKAFTDLLALPESYRDSSGSYTIHPTTNVKHQLYLRRRACGWYGDWHDDADDKAWGISEQPPPPGYTCRHRRAKANDTIVYWWDDARQGWLGSKGCPADKEFITGFEYESGDHFMMSEDALATLGARS